MVLATPSAHLAPKRQGEASTLPLPYTTRIDLLERNAAGGISPLGVAPLPDGPKMLHTSPSARFDWIFMPLQQDPSYINGTLTMPSEVKRHLRKLDESGVEFDELLIGHEIDKSLSAKFDLKDRKTLERLIEPKPNSSLPPSGVSALHSVVRAAIRATRVAAAAPAALLELMDPVLIGAVTADGTCTPGTPAALFLIARWT